MQLLKWTFRPLDYLEECAAKYGDCFVAQIGKISPPVTFVSNPEALAELYAASNIANLDAGRGQLILKLVLGKHSSMLLDGKEHKRQRQLVMPSFHGERMRVYGDTICQVTDQIIQNWQPGQQVKMHSVLSEVALQSIFKALFGFKGTQRDRLLAEKLSAYLNIFNSPIVFLVAFFPLLQRNWGPWSPYGVFVRLTQELDELMYAEIRDRRANLDPNATDVLTMLLLAKDEDGGCLSDEEMRDELFTLLFAGYDSTASVFSWVFYYVHANPDVKARLMAEIDRLGDQPNPNDLIRLPYLGAVCSESMRLRSAVPSSTPRITNIPMTIQGYEFPAESVVIPAIHLTHHRPDLYPEPKLFNPDRFLGRKFAPTEYNPYGGGARYCVGAAFASFQMKLVLATVLRRFELELVDPSPIQNARRGMNISPKGGVKLRVKGKRVAPQRVETAIAAP
jgi:unspecific monooxygenase